MTGPDVHPQPGLHGAGPALPGCRSGTLRGGTGGGAEGTDG